VTLRPSTRLRLEHTSLFTRLAAPAGLAASLGTHPTVFRNHIVRSRVDYQATRELSFRAIVDYETVRPNPALVALERRERVRADVLVTYLVNPWTALYIGYTDAFENLAFDRDLAALRRTAHPTLSTGRQVFVKVSYLARW
jgi:hypothetical protein